MRKLFLLVGVVFFISGCSFTQNAETPSQQVYLAAISYEPVQIAIEHAVLSPDVPSDVKKYLQVADKVITDGLNRCVEGLSSEAPNVVLACLSGVTRDVQQTLIYLAQKNLISEEALR